MKYFIGFLFSLLLICTGFWLGLTSKEGLFNDQITNVFTNVINEPSPDLNAYSIENLSENEIKPGKIEILKKTQEQDEFNTYLFKFIFNPDPSKEYMKSTTGVINIPKETVNPPLILMIRGYVDQDYFVSGMGTRRSSEYFAENGFITIAPDYLGYGDSDIESENIFETRFQTYTTTLSLLKTLELLGERSELLTGDLDSNVTKILGDENIFIWAHSNGGQIALTTLAVTEKDYPTVLWAPVTKPFPYSVLYYTDESDDGGKLIRSELSKLEERHDVDKFSFTNYLDSITAPIQLYQGSADEAVPYEWNKSFVSILNRIYNERELEVSVELVLKNGADHNLVPLWEESVLGSKIYFKSFLD